MPKCVLLGWTPFSILSFSLQDYPKLSQSYYSLLEVLTQDHMNFIASLEPHVIMYILSSISEGLTALGECAYSFSSPSVCLSTAESPGNPKNPCGSGEVGQL